MSRGKPRQSLSEEERLREIAAIVAAGTLRWLRGAPRTNAPEKEAEAPHEPWKSVEDENERKVLRYLQHHVSAEPVRMRQDLGIAPMTLARRLARLRSAGLVRVCGRTRGARYELSQPRTVFSDGVRGDMSPQSLPDVFRWEKAG